MCGICGFVGTGSMADLQRMNDLLKHRGPDAEGFVHDRSLGAYLAHRRLAILDPADGSQPMALPDRSLVVTFNGEIYNHLELREELKEKGHVFFTDHSDTEVLLHGYREWGSGLPDRLNGMWAFAILDKVKKRIFMSRDRFGKKPLFYSLQHATFAFASELTSLISHPRIHSAICKISLKKYFAYCFIPAPYSLYEHIYKLPAGHNLILQLPDLRITVEKYWEYICEPFEVIPEDPEEEWGGRLRELIDKAVERRLISDVPLGVFLSGGIDSSTLTAFAANHFEPGNLKSFSIGFPEASFDESPYADRVASLFHTRHHAEIFSLADVVDSLSGIAEKFDEPMGDSSNFPTYLLCGFARKHITVAIGGDGGDELFAGYDPFKALELADWYSRVVPKPIHRAILMAVGLLPTSHQNISPDFKIKRTLAGLSYPPELWNPIWHGALEPRDLDDLFREKTDIEEIYSEAIEYWDSCAQGNLTDRTIQFYIKLYLQDRILTKADRLSMMHSLEIRSPFLDIDLVDFVRRIPHDYKLRKNRTKYLLKKAMEPILPHDIIYRSKKGFGAPIGEWFKNGDMSWEYFETYGFLSQAFIQRKINEHRTGGKDNRLFLLNYWLLGHANRKAG